MVFFFVAFFISSILKVKGYFFKFLNMYATGKYIKMPRLDLKKTVKILESIVLKTTS